MIANGISLKNSPRKIFTYKGCRMKRIKELAEQAGFKVNFQHEDHQAIRMAQYKEFAELIVKECAKVLDDKLANHPDGWCDGSDLMEHFGVEE